MKKRFFLFLFLLFWIILPSFAQTRKASLELDSVEIKIGDQVRAVIKIESSLKEEVKFPVISKFLTDQVEVVELSEIDTLKIDSTRILSQRLMLTAFDSGSFLIPQISFIIKNGDNTTDTIYTNDAFLKVSLSPVDTMANIKDVKEPIDTPFEKNEIWAYLNYILIGIIAIVMVMIGVYYYKLNKPLPKPAVVVAPVTEPPRSVALKELESLKKSKKWQKAEEVKDFHEDISLILRKYIQNQFKISALEGTSNEILNDLKNRALNKVHYQSLNQILTLSDLVKFAKFKPSELENETSLKNAFQFVQETAETRLTGKTNA